MRLPNGYGSIYKLPGKRRRPYAVQITAGWTDEGKAIRKYLGYYKTRQEAIKALSDYHDTPYDIRNKDITLIEIWEKCKAFREERKKPLPREYINAFKHLFPLYSLPFISLSSRDYQQVIDSIADRPSAARHCKSALSNLYKYADFINFGTSDQSAALDMPTVPKSTMHRPYTPEELAELWEYQATDNAARLALIYCYTGLRPMELVKIKTADVHLADRYMVGGLKTRAGKDRTIPIAKKILPLIEWLYNPGNEYLLTIDGKRIANDTTLRNIFKRASTPCIHRHHLHDGRHTCETMLDNARINKRIIQLIIGHAGDVDSTYTHKTLEQLLDAIDSI